MIESFQNEKIKHITKLLIDNRFRKKNNVFTVEGEQENQRALDFGFEPIEFYICEKIFKGKTPEAKKHYITDKIYENWFGDFVQNNYIPFLNAVKKELEL